MFIPQASRKGAAGQWSAATIESTLRGGALDAKATTRAKVRPFGARVSLLRAAYLAAFAKFGYTYALRPGLELATSQIRDSLKAADQDLIARVAEDLAQALVVLQPAPGSVDQGDAYWGWFGHGLERIRELGADSESHTVQRSRYAHVPGWPLCGSESA